MHFYTLFMMISLVISHCNLYFLVNKILFEYRTAAAEIKSTRILYDFLFVRVRFPYILLISPL